ncbi:MAG: hypothetical protein IJN39_04505 [Clostridia bacterium]|nr:hypothetical protein [Clostridia bacterium]
MGFWNAVRIKAEELTRKTAKETSKLVEKTKNSIAITELNDKIKTLYKEIGEQLYTANEAGGDAPDFSEQFKLITEYKEQVASLEQENALL